MSNIYWEEHGIGPSNSSDIEIQEFKLVASPKICKNVGGYDITGNGGGVNSVIFMLKNKPSWFHRKCTKLFLGWVWVEEK